MNKLTPESDDADFMQAMDTLAAAQRAVKEAKAAFDEVFVDRLETYGDMVVGDIRYYCGTDTTYKCTNPRDAFEALLYAIGGDVDAVLATLRADPIKYGAAKGLLEPEEFDRFWVKQERKCPKTGKPKKVAKKAQVT